VSIVNFVVTILGCGLGPRVNVFARHMEPKCGTPDSGSTSHSVLKGGGALAPRLLFLLLPPSLTPGRPDAAAYQQVVMIIT